MMHIAGHRGHFGEMGARLHPRPRRRRYGGKRSPDRVRRRRL